MKIYGKSRIKQGFRNYLGEQKFDRFLDVLIERNCLMYWQVDLCRRYAKDAGIKFPSDFRGICKLLSKEIDERGQTSPRTSVG